MRLGTFAMIIVVVLAGGYQVRSNEPGQPKPAPSNQPTLEVVNESGKSFTFTAADLAKLPQKGLEARDHNGDPAKYAGVLLASVLKQADVALGAPLKGKLLASYLVVEASDKYRVVFSLPEIDPDWTDNIVLLAMSRNGQGLDEKHGPLQLVVPGDKRHSRWVKQVARLTVQSDSK